MTIEELRELLATIPPCYDRLPVTMHDHCESPHLDLQNSELVMPPVAVSRAWGVPDNDKVYAR